MINKDNEDTVDDIFVLFGSILSRINEYRKKRGLIEVAITDSERGRAIRDYVNTYPNDKIIWDNHTQQ
jgi:hypothetical protein